MRGINVAIPLTSDLTDGSYSLIKDFKKNIKQNLKTLLLSSPGERVMIPDFGVGLRAYLFEPNTRSDKNLISSRISSQINLYMPFIELQSVNIYDSNDRPDLVNDDNQIQIIISYKVSIKYESYSDILTLNVNGDAI